MSNRIITPGDLPNMGTPSGDLSTSFIPLLHKGQPRNVTILQLYNGIALNNDSAGNLAGEINGLLAPINAKISALEGTVGTLAKSAVGEVAGDALADLVAFKTSATADINANKVAIASERTRAQGSEGSLASRVLNLESARDAISSRISVTEWALSTADAKWDALAEKVGTADANTTGGIVKVAGDGKIPSNLLPHDFANQWYEAAHTAGYYDAANDMYHLNGVELTPQQARTVYRLTSQFPHKYALMRQLAVNAPNGRQRVACRTTLPVFFNFPEGVVATMPRIYNTGLEVIRFVFPDKNERVINAEGWRTECSHLLLDTVLSGAELREIHDPLVIDPSLTKVATAAGCPVLSLIRIVNLDHNIEITSPAISAYSLRFLVTHANTDNGPITVKINSAVMAKIPSQGEIVGGDRAEWARLRDDLTNNTQITFTT